MSTFRFSLPALVLATVLLYGGCQPKDTSTAANGHPTLAILVKYKGQNLALQQNNIYASGKTLKFSTFRFFLSDITFVNNGTGTAVKDIALADLATVQNGEIDIPLNDALAQEYTSMRLGVGVAAAYNAKSNSSYPATSPLSTSDDYWSGWQSFIFARIEGKLDTVGTTFNPALDVLFHTGRDPLYRSLTIPARYTVAAAGTTKIYLTLDVDKLFTNIDLTKDYDTQTEANNPAKYNLANKLMDNFALALHQ